MIFRLKTHYFVPMAFSHIPVVFLAAGYEYVDMTKKKLTAHKKYIILL